jgi:hypothetical protein
MSFLDSVTGGQAGAGWPPDTNGDIGRNHYIQAVNEAYAIYNKSGTLLASFTENSLWSGFGTTPCNGKSYGDPVVLYDQLADRWILAHMAFTYIQPLLRMHRRLQDQRSRKRRLVVVSTAHGSRRHGAASGRHAARLCEIRDLE